jgi:hypothetical protein
MPTLSGEPRVSLCHDTQSTARIIGTDNPVTSPEGSSVVLAFDLVAVGQARLRNASAL